MEIIDRLKNIIFKKLAKDLSHVEIISYRRSIWFIDRNKNYWYFKLKSNGILWWRWDFFDIFFGAFSLNYNDYEPLIVDLVENVLKRKVNISLGDQGHIYGSVEDVLNFLLDTTNTWTRLPKNLVEQVLNSK
jgi:hypothetical protein